MNPNHPACGDTHDLQLLVAAWPKLAIHSRVAILAIVEGATPERAPLPVRSIQDDIGSYAGDLARRHLSRQTQAKRLAIVRKLVEQLGIANIRELIAAGVMDFLASNSAASSWSAKTHDNHLDSLKDFGRFILGRYTDWPNAFAGIHTSQRVKPMYGGEATGVRAFTPTESDAIIAAARKVCARHRAKEKPHCSRDWLYEFLRETGLRHLEVKCLPWAVVFDDHEHPHIKCEARWTKSRRYEELPLTPRAVEILRDQRRWTGGGVKVWPLVPNWNALRKDMDRAGVPHIDARGRNAGFHSFRKELNTEAAKAGLPIDVRMRLMRHSTPRLTLGTYSDIQRGDIARLIDQHLGDRTEHLGRLGVMRPCRIQVGCPVGGGRDV